MNQQSVCGCGSGDQEAGETEGSPNCHTALAWCGARNIGHAPETSTSEPKLLSVPLTGKSVVELDFLPIFRRPSAPSDNGISGEAPETFLLNEIEKRKAAERSYSRRCQTSMAQMSLVSTPEKWWLDSGGGGGEGDVGRSAEAMQAQKLSVRSRSPVRLITSPARSSRRYETEDEPLVALNITVGRRDTTDCF